MLEIKTLKTTNNYSQILETSALNGSQARLKLLYATSLVLLKIVEVLIKKTFNIFFLIMDEVRLYSLYKKKNKA